MRTTPGRGDADGAHLLDYKPTPARGAVESRQLSEPHGRRRRAVVHTSLCPISLMVVYWTTMAVTGNVGLGFGYGESALETAYTSKEGSRSENCSIPLRGGSDKKY